MDHRHIIYFMFYVLLNNRLQGKLKTLIYFLIQFLAQKFILILANFISFHYLLDLIDFHRNLRMHLNLLSSQNHTSIPFLYFNPTNLLLLILVQLNEEILILFQF